MLNQFIIELQKRTKIESVISEYSDLFDRSSISPCFSDETLDRLLNLIAECSPTCLNVAIQAGVRWTNSLQRMSLRKAICSRGLITPACLWAHKSLRGSVEPLFKRFDAPEMSFMQILLLRHIDPSVSVPFLLENFLQQKETPEELKNLSHQCVRTILGNGITPDLLRSLQTRFPRIEILRNWKPKIPCDKVGRKIKPTCGADDFQQLVRSVLDFNELSTLTRVLYLTWMFYVPLSDRDYGQLWINSEDLDYFELLSGSGIVERTNLGYMLTSDISRQRLAKRFLFETYPLARESIQRSRSAKIKEDRERRVKSSELDRQALEMSPDGIVCVDNAKSLYYLNPAAEKMLHDERWLQFFLFGDGCFEDSIRQYSKEKIIANIKRLNPDTGISAQIFGDRISIEFQGKHFDIELNSQVILIRNTTDQILVNREIGKLYRHELSAAIDVIGIGIESAKRLISQGCNEESIKILDQIEIKRLDLFHMLEERIDFIRLHSDSFQIQPQPLNLNFLVDRCVENYLEAAANKKLKIWSNHLDGPAFFIGGEEKFLRRAIDNLIRNAIKFCTQGGNITINLAFLDNEVRLSVEDDGPGIPPKHLGKIFQLGFTTGGSGRGLYLAKKIVHAHHGRLEVKSEVGKGTCFALSLPGASEK
ncbi:MAG: PAS domain-containing sensor histidine kinase [Pseudomonadota bacterium]